MLSRVYIRSPVDDDWSTLLDLHQRSADYHSPWAEPAKNEEGCRRYIHRCHTEPFEGMLIWHAVDHRLVGVANLSQIFYGQLSKCLFGLLRQCGLCGAGIDD